MGESLLRAAIFSQTIFHLVDSHVDEMESMILCYTHVPPPIYQAHLEHLEDFANLEDHLELRFL